MPDMSAPYKRGVRHNERNITNEHYFWVNVLYAVIDLQLAELANRFPETSMELLTLSASFHPRNGFQAFKAEDVCKLASKFYPSDFTSCDMYNLEMERVDSFATAERAFSAMKIIKSDLRNKLSDEFLDDLMFLYIERTFTDCISDD
ncbi:hypothetical protein QQ045_033389 [Rhodiola kirilowii]